MMSEQRLTRSNKVDTVNWAESYINPNIKPIARGNTSTQEFAAGVWSVMDEIGNLLISKQADYGPGNVNNAFGGAMNGLMVRIGDKFERLKNLLHNGSTPNHESVEDSFKDMANYAVIALMVERGLWPKS
jgi:Nucleotide modification associated domain 1